jgi:hypothetical protein
MRIAGMACWHLARRVAGESGVWDSSARRFGCPQLRGEQNHDYRRNTESRLPLTGAPLEEYSTASLGRELTRKRRADQNRMTVDGERVRHLIDTPIGRENVVPCPDCLRHGRLGGTHLAKY